MSQKLPRRLDEIEVRVLGALMEKEQTTPEAYPLSLNALVAACNQKTNREPVLQLAESEVAAAVERLRQDVLVWRTEGARVERFKHSVERRWELDGAAKALLTVLFLRGPQTTGQLRERCERMHAFAGMADVEQALSRLADDEEPLVRELSRRPGQKEGRWDHCLAAGTGASADSDSAAAAADAAETSDASGAGLRRTAGPLSGGSERLSGGRERLSGGSERLDDSRRPSHRDDERASARDLARPTAAERDSSSALADLAARVERLEARLDTLESAMRGGAVDERE